MSGGNLLLRNNNILVAAGDISLNGRLFVKGDTSMNGKLYLTNDASLQSRLFVNGDVSFNRNVYARGNIITDVSSSTSIKGSFLVENAVNVTGVINQSTATLSGGYIYLPSNVTQEQYDALINSLTAVSNVVQVNNNTAQIGIGGATTQTMGPAWISGNLVVATSSTLGTTNLGTPYGPGSLYVGESITAPNGNVNIGKNAYIGGNLMVTTGNVTLTNGSLYVNSGLLFSQGNVVSLGGSIHSAKDISVNGLRLGKGVGGNNIAFGSSALSSVASEHYINNVAIGSNALSSVTNSGSTTYGANGSNNTALGFNAGAAVTTGGRNTFLGGNTTTSGATFNQSTALGFGATITGSNQVVLGTAAESVIMAGNVSIGKTTTPGFALDVVGNAQFSSDVSINGNLIVPTKYISVGRSDTGSMPTTGVLRVGGAYNTGTYLQIEKSGTVSWATPVDYDNTRYINCTGNAENTKDFNVGPGGLGIGYAPPIYSRGGADGLYVNGRVGVGTITPGAMLEVAGGINIQGGNVINFGSNVAGKEGNAGKIGYGTFAPGTCLDIVGAGTTSGSRKVYIYDQLGIGMIPSFPLDVTGKAQFSSDVSINGNLVVNGNLSVLKVNNQYIINQTTTNYQLIVSEDISLNGRLYVSGNVYAGQRLASGSSTGQPTTTTANAFHSFVGNT